MHLDLRNTLLFLRFFDYGKDLKCDLLKNFFSWILATRESFFTRKQTLFCIRERFFTKIVPKMAKRKSFCQKFRVFFGTQKFLLAKVSALKVN